MTNDRSEQGQNQGQNQGQHQGQNQQVDKVCKEETVVVVVVLVVEVDKSTTRISMMEGQPLASYRTSGLWTNDLISFSCLRCRVCSVLACNSLCTPTVTATTDYRVHTYIRTYSTPVSPHSTKGTVWQRSWPQDKHRTSTGQTLSKTQKQTQDSDTV